MDALQFDGNQPQSQRCLDRLENFFLVPANFTPDMPEEAWQAEIKAMFALSRVSSQFVKGEITPDEFSQALSDSGYDPYELWERWENGQTLTFD